MKHKEALDRLVEFFYLSGRFEIEWGYFESMPISEMDEELSDYLKDTYFKKDIINLRKGEHLYD